MIEIKQPASADQLKPLLSALSQLYELDRKVQARSEFQALGRNLEKMKAAFDELGYRIEDPQGQGYNETRVDLEASIAGSSTEDLVVTEVIKPIIRYLMRDSTGEYSKIIQRGVVVVESRSKKDAQ
ncbi:MAG: hypothetical protein JSS77_12610 [Acidobacteria bacterium]|nr:hypothetical protein [Acidobacteriota bacterium]